MKNRFNNLNMKNAARGLGQQVAYTAMRQHMGHRKPLDPALGWAMLRDKRVPLGAKAGALLIGAALTFGVEALELPLEGIIGLALPFFGFAGSLLFDGAETAVGPFLFGALVLPHIAPAEVTDQLRAERGGYVLRDAKVS